MLWDRLAWALPAALQGTDAVDPDNGPLLVSGLGSGTLHVQALCAVAITRRANLGEVDKAWRLNLANISFEGGRHPVCSSHYALAMPSLACSSKIQPLLIADFKAGSVVTTVPVGVQKGGRLSPPWSSSFTVVAILAFVNLRICLSRQRPKNRNPPAAIASSLLLQDYHPQRGPFLSDHSHRAYLFHCWLETQAVMGSSSRINFQSSLVM